MKTKSKTVFSCQTCGYQTPKWLGRCPDCGAWNSFVEEQFGGQPDGRIKNVANNKLEPVLLNSVRSKVSSRLTVGIKELDRVLGGGIVRGSVILLGGDPGIGKSTIALQISSKLVSGGFKILYVGAEESLHQTKLRADRLGVVDKGNLYIVNQIDLDLIMGYFDKIKPDLVVVDSIQVLYSQGISSSPGSISQVRECAGQLIQLAKSKNISLIVIGHVTKEGNLAGPKVLEHLVDTVLYFEGEKYSLYRLLRTVKNRFGSTNEIGVFQMTQLGLSQVENPCEIFLSERPLGVSGSAVTCILEGTRPLLIEVQALVSRSTFGYAQRKAQGIDYNRLCLLIAVLQKRLGFSLSDKDIFMNIAGGIRVIDPAVDLAAVVSIVSAFKDKALDKNTIFLGEVGLTGEIRSVNQVALRVNEASKLGFKTCVLAKNNLKNIQESKHNIKLIGINTIKEILGFI